MKKSKLNVGKRIKQLLMIVLLLGIICGVEVWENIHTIRGGTKVVDLTSKIVEKETEYSIVYKLSKTQYIDRLRLTGQFSGEKGYTVKIAYKNGFGKAVTKTITDYVNNWITEAYTPIDEYVTSIEITLPKSSKDLLEGVFLVNAISINRFRMMLMGSICLIGYCLIFYADFFRKPERFFVVFALVFGILNIVMAQSSISVWDEEVHFGTSYRLASGRTVVWDEASYNTANRLKIRVNTKEESELLKKYLDEKGTEYALTEYRSSILPGFRDLAYIPNAMCLFVARVLRLPFSWRFPIGKLGSLIPYIVCMYWAIRLAKVKQLFVTFLAMMPTPLLLASSYSYDSTLFSFFVFGCVIWINMMYEEDAKKDTLQFLGCILLFSIGCSSKAVYIPVMVLMLMLPWLKKRRRKKETFVLLLGIVAIMGLVAVTFVLPILSNAAAGNIAYGGDSRGGDTGAVRQLLSMIHHPQAAIKLLLQIDNWTFYRVNVNDIYPMGIGMFLNMASLGKLSAKWETLLVVVLTVTALYKDETEDRFRTPITGWRRLIPIGVLVSIVWAIWMAMYLSFTEVGHDKTVGVQARYYLPLIYLFVLQFDAVGIHVRAKRESIVRMVWISTVFFEAACIYYLMLHGRLV